MDLKIGLVLFMLFWSLTGQTAIQELGTSGGVKRAIDKSIVSTINSGKVHQSYFLEDFDQWLKRPGSELLLPTDNYVEPKDEDLAVFHTRMYFVVDRPVSSFQSSNFYTLDFLKSIDPDKITVTKGNSKVSKRSKAKYVKGSEHREISQGANGTCEGFCVQSKIYFADMWASIIAAARWAKVLDEHNTGYLQVDSEFIYSPAANLPKQTQQSLNSLIRTRLQPNFVVHQSGYKVNQMAQFTTAMFTAYAYGDKTLVAVDMVTGLEKDVDEKISNNGAAQLLIQGFTNIDPEKLYSQVLLGTAPSINTNYGVSSGLPKHQLTLVKNLKKYMESL